MDKQPRIKSPLRTRAYNVLMREGFNPLDIDAREQVLIQIVKDPQFLHKLPDCGETTQAEICAWLGLPAPRAALITRSISAAITLLEKHGHSVTLNPQQPQGTTC